MTSLTLSLSEELRNKIKELIWVNWSEIAREEATKKLIFENYMKSKNLTDEEWKFCEKIDWHPVDELPLKEEFVKKMQTAKKEKGIKFKSISDLRKIIEQ
jgi:protein involved in temperature-dependent protein secretion